MIQQCTELSVIMFLVRFCNSKEDDKQSHVLENVVQRGRDQEHFRILLLTI